jgi:hypothetical protein
MGEMPSPMGLTRKKYHWHRICVVEVAMSNANAMLTVFDTPIEAIAAIRHVQDSGYAMSGISAAWRDTASLSDVTGFYKDKHGMKYWGDLDALLNEVFQSLSGWALFSIPGIGRVLIIGPLANWIALALANAAIFGEMSAIGMGLYSVGISRGSIQICEEALKNGKCLLLLNGSSQEVKKAKQVIDECAARCSPELQ